MNLFTLSRGRKHDDTRLKEKHKRTISPTFFAFLIRKKRNTNHFNHNIQTNNEKKMTKQYIISAHFPKSEKQDSLNKTFFFL